jgi:hypothetical protein
MIEEFILQAERAKKAADIFPCEGISSALFVR